MLYVCKICTPYRGYEVNVDQTCLYMALTLLNCVLATEDNILDYDLY